MANALVVIPARGGSKGIPRKNLSPIAGKPLLAWAILAARQARGVSAVVVSTDDDEIARVAERFGARALPRDASLAGDAVTLDPVVHDAVRREEAAGRRYDLVLTVQPTSPLLRSATIERILHRLETEPLDTILTAVNDTHLSWETRDGKLVPAYQARVNRQSLPARFKETGGVLATRRENVTEKSRIGARVALEVLDGFEGLDIDSRDDWLTAEAALGRRRLAFIVIGNERQGLGHVTRTLTLLECLNAHEVRVFCTPAQDLAIDRFRAAFYGVEVVAKEALHDALVAFGPHIVVHDELDTDPEVLRREKAAGFGVVVFEDNGPGRNEADLLLNALFPAEQTDVSRNWFFGPAVYCLRDEFRHATRGAPEADARRVLISFGGTDPAGLTFKVLEALDRICDLPITVVAGRGLQRYAELEALIEQWKSKGRSIELLRDIRLMSEQMARADIAFSSAGRTLYELAHMRVPAIVLAQNEVEMKHTFASIENGFLFLGRGEHASQEDIASAFRSLRENRALREALRERMVRMDLTRGLDLVVRKILELK